MALGATSATRVAKSQAGVRSVTGRPERPGLPGRPVSIEMIGGSENKVCIFYDCTCMYAEILSLTTKLVWSTVTALSIFIGIY